MPLQTKFKSMIVPQSVYSSLLTHTQISLSKPNSETIAAMLEAERIAKDPSVKGYNDLDELFADLKA